MGEVGEHIIGVTLSDSKTTQLFTFTVTVTNRAPYFNPSIDGQMHEVYLDQLLIVPFPAIESPDGGIALVTLLTPSSFVKIEN